MNSKLALGARALAAGVLFGAIPAGATTIDIGLAEAPGIGNITTVATGSAAGVGWAGSYDKYAINAVLASDPDPIGLTSGTIDVKGPNATSAIYLYVTETGIGVQRKFIEHIRHFELADRLDLDGNDLSGQLGRSLWRGHAACYHRDAIR
jgi:hypothetical protein